VGDGLEPAVRVPGRALRFARRILHFAHLVHMDERVEVGEVDAGERTPDWKPLTLEAAGCGGDRTNRSLGRIADLRDARQRGDVFDGDGWHGRLPLLRSRP